MRNITLFILGGVAQIGTEPPSAAAEFWIAIAGPIVSFALVALFNFLQATFTGIAPVLALAKYLAYINGTLALFNLIPGFPLDGGRVFRAIVWGIPRNLRQATLIAANVGRVIAFVFIRVGVWQLFQANFGNGLWIAFIGWFLESAAVGQVQQQRVHDLLAGRSVSQAMSRSYSAIPADTTLQQLVDRRILETGRRRFLATQGDEAVGLLTLHQVKEVLRDKWPSTIALQATTPMAQMKQVTPETELWDALEEMDRDGVNQLPVMTDSHCIGMLSREDLISYLRTVREIGI